MSLMEQFANPDTMHSLSFGDKMAGAGITTLMGMGITFCILILLWGVIAVMTRIMASADKKKAAPAPAAAAPAPAAAAPAAAAAAPAGDAVPASNDAELTAVIAAAIAAYEGDGEVKSDLVVRRIRRIAGSTPAWAREGRDECIESRRV